MTNIFIKAAIKLLERKDSVSALFILKYIIRVIEYEDIPFNEVEKAGDILSNLN